MDAYVDPRALVEDGAQLGRDCAIWAFTQIRRGVKIGAGTTIGSHAYIDTDVVIGSNCKIQSGALVFHGTEIADGVFVGPGAIVTNDNNPRAITPEGTLKDDADWCVEGVTIGHGASIGAGAILVAGIDIGEYALVAAGAVVTKDVAPHELVAGIPARGAGWVCLCGHRLQVVQGLGVCPSCRRTHQISSQ